MFECALKSVDVVETLACETAFAEEVLINVGEGGRVGIDAGITRKDLHKLRTRSTRQRDTDARLQNTVTVSNAIVICIDAWFVEWMNRRADELPRNIPRELSVRIEGYDVPN